MDNEAFTLDPTLEKDTVEIKRLGVCRVLLMRDKTYPWIIMVPAIPGLRDFDDLSPTHRTAVTTEMDQVSKALKSVCQPYKINVAALGNVVEQLHIHVIARFQDDAAWPGPVWGAHPPIDYDEEKRSELISKIKSAL